MKSLFLRTMPLSFKRITVLIGLLLSCLCCLVWLTPSQSTQAQTSCSSEGTWTKEYEKQFENLGDKLEISLPSVLKPCETLLINYEQLIGNANLGTNMDAIFYNEEDEQIYTQRIDGFSTTSITVPAPDAGVCPWLGVVGPKALPKKISIISVWPYGSSGGVKPKYKFTITRKARTDSNLNVGGKDPSSALVTSLPATFLGTLTALEGGAGLSVPYYGQTFKVTLEPNEGFYIDVYAKSGNFLSGANFDIELYTESLVDITPPSGGQNPSWRHYTYYNTSDLVKNTTSPYINPNPTTSVFYIRIFCNLNWIPNFVMVINRTACTNCTCPQIFPIYPRKSS